MIWLKHTLIIRPWVASASFPMRACESKFKYELDLLLRKPGRKEMSLKGKPSSEQLSPFQVEERCRICSSSHLWEEPLLSSLWWTTNWAFSTERLRGSRFRQFRRKESTPGSCSACLRRGRSLNLMRDDLSQTRLCSIFLMLCLTFSSGWLWLYPLGGSYEIRQLDAG